MPLYDYRCTACGFVVEVMHGIGGSGPETCEACGGVMRKAVSTPSIHFKGSGWAKKDAAAASAKKAKPKPGASPATTSPSNEKSGDAAGSGSADSGSTGSGSGKDSKPAAPTSAKAD